jgi:hypothetical protein
MFHELTFHLAFFEGLVGVDADINAVCACLREARAVSNPLVMPIGPADDDSTDNGRNS